MSIFILHLLLDNANNSTGQSFLFLYGLADNAILVLIFEVAVVAALAWLVSQVLSRVITRGARRAGVPPRVVSYIRVALNAIWILVTVSVILSISSLGSLSGVLTVSGLVTLAISLALQNTFSNMIAGILLFHDNILRIGDMIQFGSIKGRVMGIWLRNTWIQTDDGTLVIVSNNNLSSGPLINFTATERLTRKIDDLSQAIDGHRHD